MIEDEKITMYEFPVKIIPGTSALLAMAIRDFRANRTQLESEALVLNILWDQIDKGEHLAISPVSA